MEPNVCSDSEHAATEGARTGEEPSCNGDQLSQSSSTSWLECNPRKDGQEGLPAIPTIFLTPVQDRDHNDGKLRNFQVHSVMVSPHRRRS